MMSQPTKVKSNHKENKKMWKKIGLLSVVTLLAASLAACSAVSAASTSDAQVAPAPATGSESSDTPRTITVVGTGNVSLVPDVAVINVGAEARADTVFEARAEVDAIWQPSRPR